LLPDPFRYRFLARSSVYHGVDSNRRTANSECVLRALASKHEHHDGFTSPIVGIARA